MNNSKKILKPLLKSYCRKYYVPLFKSQEVKKLSYEEATKIKDLQNKAKIHNMLRVYGDKKFNDSANGLNDEQKAKIKGSLYNARDHEQFHSGCEAFCFLSLEMFDNDFDLFFDTINSITNAKYEFQATYALYMLKDCYIYGGENFDKIVRFITKSPNEELAESIYNSMFEEGTIPDVDGIISSFSNKEKSI